MLCFLYTPIYRTNGTEYIFQGSLKNPVAERFTMHFIERYKERHLIPHNIDIGAIPVPLHFQIHNPDCILGRYYKTSDIDIAEGKHKRFWIAPEGIYVTDYIDGMLTYITFMDKDDLSPLKKQVYEEEIVWDLMLRVVNEKLSSEERTKAAFSISNNPDLGQIFERFAQRNVKDNADGEKQKLLSCVRKEMAIIKEIIDETKKRMGRRKILVIKTMSLTVLWMPVSLLIIKFIEHLNNRGSLFGYLLTLPSSPISYNHSFYIQNNPQFTYNIVLSIPCMKIRLKSMYSQ